MSASLEVKRNYCEKLGNPYAKLSVFSERELKLENKVHLNQTAQETPYANGENAREKAKSLLRKLWKNSENQLNEISDFLKEAPYRIATDLLGHTVLYQPDFHRLQAIEGKVMEIAGFADRDSNVIGIINSYSDEVQRFTLAHEIGHMVLHTGKRQFRDKPIYSEDSFGSNRDIYEREANAFAAELLMPEKTVRSEFNSMFGDSISLEDNENIICELISMSSIASYSPEAFTKLHINQKASFLAQVSVINGRHRDPLHKRFHVSPMALGIRLKELGLVY